MLFFPFASKWKMPAEAGIHDENRGERKTPPSTGSTSNQGAN